MVLYKIINNKMNILDFFKELQQIVGENSIELKRQQDDIEQIIIQPINELQIKKILDITNKYVIPIYPISRGRNYGYGLHIKDKRYIILDLSKMNKILDFDEELGCVTIEPGVTYYQLEQFLKKNKSKLMLSTTGSFPDASLLAHAVERGIGKGEYSNSFNYSCGYKIILATGEIVYTGYLKYTKAKASTVSAGGSGPLLQGLFTQSNLGIVVQITLWLQKRPKYFNLISYYLKNDNNLPEFIDVIHKLKQEGLLVGNSLLANTYRILTGMTQYPWIETKGVTPLKEKFLKQLMKEWEWKGQWYGDFLIGSNHKDLIEIQQKIIVKRLKKVVTHLQIIDHSTAQFIKYAKKKSANFNVWSLDNLYDERVTNPLSASKNNIRMLYWRKKKPIPDNLNPEKDKCGIIWINTEIPFRSVDIMNVNKISAETLTHFKFEPNIGFNLISERSLIGTICIIFDAEIKKEGRNAHMCRSELLKKLALYGYFPYRNGNLEELVLLDKNQSGLLKKIKKLVDPNNILAPQRNN
jgi:4-cresol dehydrogenase (hydroxylating)